MPARNALQLSRGLLASLGIRTFVYNEDNIPTSGSVVIASNHRSFLDAFVLMSALNRPIRFACHHYMGQVPLLRELVSELGCFPLDSPERRQQSFFRQGIDLLGDRQYVGVFPEGTEPMVNWTHPRQVCKFHRGFAHLALQFASRTERQDVAVLPVALVALSEHQHRTIPVSWLRVFDPSEPLFDRPGTHPLVVYKRLAVAVGRPYWLGERDRQGYQGTHAKAAAQRLTDRCRHDILDLLHQNGQ